MAERVLFGWHAIEALLERHPERVMRLQCQQGRDDRRWKQVRALAQQFGIAMETCYRHTLDELTDGENHQGIVARVKPGPNVTEADLLERIESAIEPPFLLVLDGVTDPHNLGACLRTADAAGVSALVVPRDHSAPLNGVAIKVASGGAESVPVVRVTNLARFMRQCRELGVWFTGTAEDAKVSIHEVDLRGPLCVVMGAEGAGMRRLTREHCDHLATLPMGGLVSSLNVSVATGICLFEARRQRLIASGDFGT
mgnify:CR=1 FL=1